MDVTEIIAFTLFIGWVIVGLYAALSARGLPKYIYSNYYDRWCYLTSGPWWGPGGVNSFRWWRYIFSDQDNEDPRVVTLKAASKRGMLWVLGYWLFLLFLALLVGVFVVFFQKA